MLAMPDIVASARTQLAQFFRKEGLIDDIVREAEADVRARGGLVAVDAEERPTGLAGAIIREAQDHAKAMGGLTVPSAAYATNAATVAVVLAEAAAKQAVAAVAERTARQMVCPGHLHSFQSVLQAELARAKRAEQLGQEALAQARAELAQAKQRAKKLDEALAEGRELARQLSKQARAAKSRGCGCGGAPIKEKR
jgi:hypothetical protein